MTKEEEMRLRKIQFKKTLSSTRNQELVKKYVAGMSAPELAIEYGISARSIQRVCAMFGVTRSRSEAYKLAIKKGRMRYYKKPEHLKKKRKHISPAQRLRTFIKDNYTCRICGYTRGNGLRLEVDHIDEDVKNNADHNLQTLCEDCNKGKAYNSDRWKELQEDKRKFYSKK